MAKCLTMICPNPAIDGSDFCDDHQLGSNPVIYLKEEESLPWGSGPSSAGEPEEFTEVDRHPEREFEF